MRDSRCAGSSCDSVPVQCRTGGVVVVYRFKKTFREYSEVMVPESSKTVRRRSSAGEITYARARSTKCTLYRGAG